NVGDQVVENSGEGNDTVYASVDYNLAANVENLILQGGATQGYGNTLNNTIYGTGGDNLLNGNAGADSMYGGAGNDSYFVDNVGDQVVENSGEGNDTVYASVDYNLAASVENLILQSGATQGYGNTLNNTIYGTGGDNLLNGNAGADSMYRGAGNDSYFVDNAGDQVVENSGAGNDTVYASVDYTLAANVENLILQGGATQGYGNSDNNSLFGTAGVNLLDGKAGIDILTGGGGDDF